MAGCPKCSCEIPRVNTHKVAVTHPNGYVTFKELRVGETIHLPDEWFHPARESLPATYYKILPHHNGVTRGTLGDSPELDPAVTAVARLAAMGDAAFVQAVGDAGAKVDAVVKGADAAKAKLVRDATHWAWVRNRDLAAAVAANDRAAVTKARLDIQNALSTALGNAHLAIRTNAPSPVSSNLQAAAKAAVAAISADPNYCTSVTHPGTPVNAAVHKFKTAWNASQSLKVPVGTGTYEVATVVALAQVAGSAPSACGGDRRPVPAPKPPPAAKSIAASSAAPDDDGFPWGWTVVTVLGVAAVGGIAYAATRKPTRTSAAHREYAS